MLELCYFVCFSSVFCSQQFASLDVRRGSSSGDVLRNNSQSYCLVRHRCSLVLQVNEAGGGATGGLNSVSTVTRLVIRDACGRYCWDNSILYGSNPSASNSSKTATSASDSHALNTDTELRTRSPSDKPQTSSFEVDDVILEAPVFGSVHSNRDTLDQVRILFFL